MINIERQPQTWQNDYLIPVVQNVTGAVSASAIVTTMSALFFNPMVSTIQALALLVFVIFAGISTLIRFFGDEFGLLKMAYRSGQQSAENEINRLQNMLHDAEQKIDAFEAAPDIAIGTTRNNQQILDAVADAEKLVSWSYTGQTISRAACGRRGMGQRAWERANQTLSNAGIIADGQWAYDDQGAALRALRGHFERRQRQSKSGNVVTPY